MSVKAPISPPSAPNLGPLRHTLLTSKNRVLLEIPALQKWFWKQPPWETKAKVRKHSSVLPRISHCNLRLLFQET